MEYLCIIKDCTTKSTARGMCVKHYGRWRRHGDPYNSRKETVRKAKPYLDKNGYRAIPINSDYPGAWSNGYIFEHKYIMQEHLGRALLSNENVHHKNGVRNDNCLDNLELWSSSQPPGQRIEDKVAWALEILKLYAPNYLENR